MSFYFPKNPEKVQNVQNVKSEHFWGGGRRFAGFAAKTRTQNVLFLLLLKKKRGNFKMAESRNTGKNIYFFDRTGISRKIGVLSCTRGLTFSPTFSQLACPCGSQVLSFSREKLKS